MNRQRLIISLLVASWTLNVALGVALYLKSSYPPGGYWETPDRMSESGFPPFKGNRRMFSPEVHDEIQALGAERNRLTLELAEAFAMDSLDMTWIYSIRDSLDSLHRDLHHNQIDFMMKMHDQLPEQARRDLVPRMMRRMKMHGPPGQHGMWRNHGKRRNTQ